MIEVLLPLLLFGTFISLAFRLEFLRLFKRRRTMQQFAESHRLVLLDSGVLPLPTELLDRISPSLDVEHCLHGWWHGEQVFAFDYLVGWGRQKRRFTAVALEQKHPRDFRPVRLRKTFRGGRWVIATRRSGFFVSYLLSPNEIAQEWDAMQTTTPEEQNAARDRQISGEVVIRPRHERSY